MLRLFVALAALFAMSACQPVAANKLPAPSYTALAPLNLNVGNVEVIDEYQPPLKAPNAEHLFPYSPADTFKIWMQDRIKPMGGENRLVATIKDARVIETALPRTEGFKGAFTNDQVARYDATINVELKLYKGAEIVSIADVSAHANRSRTLKEDASPQERDELFYQINKELLDELNNELEKNIRTYFAAYLQ